MITIEQNGGTRATARAHAVYEMDEEPSPLPLRETKTRTWTVRNVTPAKVEANRRNGRLSRGPKTAKGKESSRLNAITHGLFVSVLPKIEWPVLADRNVVEQLMNKLQEDFQPSSQLEMTLVETLVFEFMRLRAIHAIESTIWEDNRPPDQGSESMALKALAEHESKGTEKTCSERIELLTRFMNAIGDRNDDAITEPEAVQMVERMQTYFDSWNEAVQRYQAEIQIHEQPQKPKVDALFASVFGTTVEELKKNIEETLADEKHRGAPAHGCEDHGNIDKFVRKPSLIPEEFRVRWQQTMNDFVQSNEEQLRTVEGYRRKVAQYRRRRIEGMLEQFPRLERMNKYETMVRRNIERTINELCRVRQDLFGAD